MFHLLPRRVANIADMLKYRLIFGPLMIAAFAVIFHFDNRLDNVPLNGTVFQRLFLGREYLPAGLLMLGAFILLIVLSAREFSAIATAKGIPADTFMLTLSGITGCVLIYIIPVGVNSQVATAAVATLMSVLFLMALVKYSWVNQRTQGAILVGGLTMMAFVYLGILPGFYVAIRRWHSAWVVAAIILITKCCDIGAYATGRLIGRHKLIPWLSPGKTWEGLIGGVLLSAVVATGLTALSNALNSSASPHGLHVYDKIGAIRHARPVIFPLWAAFLAGATIGVVGQFGDLVASLFKRDAGFKDSGKSIPGFGGLLDVLDSPVIVAPLAYWLLYLASQLSESGIWVQH